jgi:hypothetical protein
VKGRLLGYARCCSSPGCCSSRGGCRRRTPHSGSILIGGLAAWIGGIYLKVRFARPDDTLGSAHGSDRRADVNALAKNKGDLLIGRDTFGRLLRYDGPAHLITIAPTRSGKGVGTIIPNLLDRQSVGRLHRSQG